MLLHENQKGSEMVCIQTIKIHKSATPHNTACLQQQQQQKVCILIRLENTISGPDFSFLLFLCGAFACRRLPLARHRRHRRYRRRLPQHSAIRRFLIVTLMFLFMADLLRSGDKYAGRSQCERKKNRSQTNKNRKETKRHSSMQIK